MAKPEKATKVISSFEIGTSHTLKDDNRNDEDIIDNNDDEGGNDWINDTNDDDDDVWWLKYQFDALHFFFRLEFKLLPSPLLLHCEVTLQLSIVITLNIKMNKYQSLL